MPGLMHDSGFELNLEDLQFAGRHQESSLVVGQAIVICDGILKGATGIVAKGSTPGHCLASLGKSPSNILARLPAHLVRAT
jgi:hypothetical protein